MPDVENDEPQGGRFDAEALIRSLVARNGNSEQQALRVLADENYQHRKRIRSLRTENETLRKRPEIKEGQRILTVDEAKRFDAFEELKLKPEDVKVAITERDTLKAKDAERQEAADIANGVKRLKLNPEVLTDLIRSRRLQRELRDVEVDKEDGEEGEKEIVKVLHLRAADNDAWTPADTFAKTHLKGYLPALVVKDDDNADDDGDTEAVDEPPRSRPFPRQQPRPKDKAPSRDDVVSKYSESKYVPPSKLRQSQGA